MHQPAEPLIHGCDHGTNALKSLAVWGDKHKDAKKYLIDSNNVAIEYHEWRSDCILHQLSEKVASVSKLKINLAITLSKSSAKLKLKLATSYISAESRLESNLLVELAEQSFEETKNNALKHKTYFLAR